MDRDETRSIDYSLDEELWLGALCYMKSQDGGPSGLMSQCDYGRKRDAIVEQLWNMADGLLSIEESESIWEHVQKCAVCARELRRIQQAIVDSEMEKIYTLEEVEALLEQDSPSEPISRSEQEAGGFGVLEMAIRFAQGKVELLRTTGRAMADMGAVATRAKTPSTTPSVSCGAATALEACRVETRIESDKSRCHIEVRVLDPAEAQRLLDVDLTLIDARDNIIESVSAPQGKHRFEDLPPADYSIDIFRMGDRIGQVQIKRE